MPIKSNPPGGSLSFYNDIRAEFGGATPLSLSNYYRGGSRVPNYPINNNIPTSGTIKFSDFYGASAIPPITPTTLQYTSYSGKIYFPLGIKHFTVQICIGGGGGGNGGTEIGDGYGGGGGGSAGYITNYVFSVTSNDYIECWPGAGGAGADYISNGGNGGNSYVGINGGIAVAVPGGAGATAPGVGGIGVSPGGNPGADGLFGSYDGASGYGGAGGSSPWGTGGARGSFGPYFNGYNSLSGSNSIGGNATGYGAGGGGAGFTDRPGAGAPIWWNGGNGSTGFIQIYYDGN
jgi:hypothetical protein